MSRIPAGAATAATALAAGAGALLLAGIDWVTTTVGLLGLTFLLVGYAAEASRPVNLGGGLLFAMVVVAGAVGLRPVPVVAGGVGAFLAWTFARTAVSLRRDLGDASTGRLELTHLAGTTVLAAVALVAAYVPFVVGRTGTSPLGLSALVVGAVLLTLSLRPY